MTKLLTDVGAVCNRIAGVLEREEHGNTKSVSAAGKREWRMTEDKIVEYLKSYGKESLQVLFSVVRKAIVQNSDFLLTKKEDGEDIAALIDESLQSSGQKLDFDIGSILTEEERTLYDQLDEIEQKEIRKEGAAALKVSEIREIMAKALTSPTLFEGMCLSLRAMPEFDLADFCAELGATEAYEKLCADPVYQSRKQYSDLIYAYTKAAVNLYGVQHLSQIYQLLWKYERTWKKREAYVREGGSYRHTLAWCPRYLCIPVLHDVIGNTIPDVCTTMDGMVLHKVFFEDFRDEVEKMGTFFQKQRQRKLNKQEEISETDLDAFFTGEQNRSYRRLFNEALQKPKYEPRKAEFLRYTHWYRVPL